MQKFGQLQNLWEGGGGGQGGKVLSFAKPYWNGYKKNLQQHLTDKML